MNDLTLKSKFLAYVLRHKPEKAKLTLDKEGWCSIEQLLANTDITKWELEDIVVTDDKCRYSFSEDGTKIRANQGHSTDTVKLSFKSAVPPAVLYHGTSTHSCEAIKKDGLKPMARRHVHLAEDIDTARSVAGRRKGDVCVLKVDAKQMLVDDYKFYLSDNGVWLVDRVPSIYLSEV